MKYSLLLFTCCISICMVAQTDEARRDSINARRKLYVGFMACPLITLQQFRKHTNTNYQNPQFDNANQVRPGAGFVGGFEFAYHGRHVGFETGLSYRTYANITRIWTGDTPAYSTNQERYHNLEIPFLFSVYSKPAKVRFIASIGVAGDLTLIYTSNLLNESQRSLFKGSQPGGFFPNWVFYDGIAQAKMGVEVAVTPTMVLSVSPAFYAGFLSAVTGGINIEVLFGVKDKKT